MKWRVEHWIQVVCLLAAALPVSSHAQVNEGVGQQGGAASAEEDEPVRWAVLEVNAASGPWDRSANSEMPFGGSDAKPPVTFPLEESDYGLDIGIVADGVTSVGGKSDIGPTGVQNDPANDLKVKGKRYPSVYTPKVLYPVNRHALMAAFVDEKNVLVGRPFPVGEGVRVPILEGARALTLGFNDVKFSKNSGALKVTVFVE